MAADTDTLPATDPLVGSGDDAGGRLGRTIRAAARQAFRPTRRNMLHWASFAITLGAELALVVVLWEGPVFGWEQAVTRRLQGLPGEQLVFDVTSTATNTLSVPFLVPFVILVVALMATRHYAVGVLVGMTFPLHVLAQFPKALVDRPRPSPEFPGIEGVGGFQSFPSGHAEFVVTFYGFLVFMALLRLRSGAPRFALVAVFLCFALATGYGRIALGRHWALDVMAGYVVGGGLLSGLVWLYATWREVSPRSRDVVS